MHMKWFQTVVSQRITFVNFLMKLQCSDQIGLTLEHLRCTTFVAVLFIRLGTSLGTSYIDRQETLALSKDVKFDDCQVSTANDAYSGCRPQ